LQIQKHPETVTIYEAGKFYLSEKVFKLPKLKVLRDEVVFDGAFIRTIKRHFKDKKAASRFGRWLNGKIAKG